MKKSMKKGMKNVTAILMTAVMVLSVFAVLPAGLFKVGAADTTELTMREELQQMMDDLIGEGGPAVGNVNYERADITPDGEVVYDDEVILPNGEYVITGVADYQSMSEGVMTHTAVTSGLRADGTVTGTTPAETSDTWFFEKQSSGKYHIYYEDSNGAKQYLNIGNSTLTVTTSAQELVVEATTSGEVTVGDGNGNYINYSGGEVDVVGVYTDATNLTLYTVTRTTDDSTKEELTGPLTSVDQVTTGDKYIIAHSDNAVLNYDLTFEGAVSLNSNTWIIEVVDDGWQIKKSDEERYLSFDANNRAAVQLTEEAATFQRSIDSATGTLQLWQNLLVSSNNCDPENYYLQSDGGSASSTRVQTNATTHLNLYKIETITAGASVTVTKYEPTLSSTPASPVEDGGYVIYNQNYILSSEILTSGSNTGVTRISATPSNNIITADRVNEYRVTRASAYNKYYIQNSSGQYMSIGTNNGALTFTNTPTEVTIYGRTDGTVVIYRGSYALNHYTSSWTTQMFSVYDSDTTATTATNEWFTLYKNPSLSDVIVPVGKAQLYTALVAGLEYNPDTYTAKSYKDLFDVLKEGYEIYKDDSVTNNTTIITAAQNIRNAIVNLEEKSSEPDYRSFPATLYKFGYNPSASGNSRYSAGGAAFNAQTYASMEEKIRADEGLMTQIKDVIGYDTRTWNSGQAEAALDTVIAAYAKIYSLAFTGYAVTNGTNVSGNQITAWNTWTKQNTTDRDSGDTRDEGASVQGLFSSMLVDGNPSDHALYKNALPYKNVVSSSMSSYGSNILTVSISDSTGSNTVNLTPLEGISVHINDVFTRENVLADGSTTEYSKYYWDLDFPFLTTTNSFGINTYKYSSSDTTRLFQAEFDDENHTAEAQLTEVSSWGISKPQSVGTGGFFPFNYQNGVTSYTGESAIYHYGMTFSTEFYIPVSGTYSDGEDIVFKFSGDDDVLVYVDDVLVLDNGGLHGARAATINFTDASVNYQYALDISDDTGTVKSTTPFATTYTYGEDAGYNGDTLAALEKLNEVRTDGEYHTFTFYYLERGSTASNCEIEFNLQQASNHVLLNDETLVVDYGLPVEYNIKDNDDVDAIDGLSYTYEGVVQANKEVLSVITFDYPNDLVSTFAFENDILDVQELKFGTATMRGDGLVTYTPTTLQMTGRDYFYTCAAITGDPTYASNTVYYQYERAVFIPATTIYYEDNFGANISFNDGSGTAKWTTVGDTSAFADAKQAADLVGDVTANPYGYDPIYAGADTTKDYTMYSGFSAQKVTVSKNLATNPTVEFTFTGTGFDIISMTDSTTGAFYVDIFDANNKQVGKKMVVDTYYGYSYGQLYADADGKATLTETDTPLYKSAVNEAIAKEPTYYSVDGIGYTETPTYYDAYGNITEAETENPAYAYAYGWVTADNVEGLYQIPVIKKTDLDYGTYTVVITPMYSRLFDNTGKGQFDVYIDAIRIYNPAGEDDNIESSILTDYKYDNESYPNYLTIKDIIIGADSLSKDSTSQGVIFIDGIAALDNDLEKYKLAGPNNELYLAKDQAIAFEIWATAIPDEVQLGVKSVKDKPTLGITYNGNTVEKDINTATEMNYIINNLLPTDGKLKWSEVVVNGEPYYRTDTIVIQNLSDDASILSLTNMKWTFTGVGQHGHYETQATEPVMMFMSRRTTVSDAYAMMSANNVPNDDETDNDAGSEIIPDDNNTNDTNDTNDENQGVLTLIQKIIEAITNFFKKIFGLA